MQRSSVKGCQRTLGLPARLMLVALFTALGVPCGSHSQAGDLRGKLLLAESGRTYMILSESPLRLGTGKMAYGVSYATRLNLSDQTNLRREATEIAREILRRERQTLGLYPEGISISALDRPPGSLVMAKPNGSNTLLGPADLLPILSDLNRKGRPFRLLTSGWSRTPFGPIEKITEAIRGQTYHLLAILDGVTQDPSGLSELGMQITVTSPAGPPETAQQVGKLQGSIALPVAAGRLRLDPGDPVGVYSIDLVVNDRATGKSLKVPRASLLLK